MAKPKAVSSWEGKIDHVLLVFPEYLLPTSMAGCKDKDIDEIIEEKVLDYYGPLMLALTEDGQKKDVHFDFVVEYKVIVQGDSHQKPFQKQLNSLWFASHPDDEKEGGDELLGYARTRHRDDWSFRLLYTNIDFDEIAREAMRAIDFDSNFVTLGHVKELLQSVQDPFVPLSFDKESGKESGKELDEGVVILEPFFAWPTAKGFPSPFNFKYIPEVISSQTNILLKSFPFYLQGGNVLVGDDFVFMGGDVARKNLEAYQDIDKREYGKQKSDLWSLLKLIFKFGKHKHNHVQLDLPKFKTLFANLLGLKYAFVVDGIMDERPRNSRPSSAVVAPPEVRDNPEELFHLDTFLTLAGKFVSDQYGIVKDLVLLAKIYVWSCNGWTSEIDDDPNPRLRILKDFLEQCRKQLEASATTRFVVKELPLMYHNGQFYSYNNCLIEVYQDAAKKEIKRAYVPTFAFKKLDDCIESDKSTGKPDFCDADIRAREVFKCCEFEPIPVDMNFRSFAHSRVGLHCMVSVLSRSSS